MKKGRKKRKKKKMKEKVEKEEVKNQLKNFACDTHLKFTKGKRIQLKILGGGNKSNFSKNKLPCLNIVKSFYNSFWT